MQMQTVAGGDCAPHTSIELAHAARCTCCEGFKSAVVNAVVTPLEIRLYASV